MSTKIESLELEILSSSVQAENGLNKLTQSLEKLKKATSGGVGLTSVAKQVTSLANATNSINGTSIDNLNKLSTALQSISSLGKIKLGSTVNQLNRIPSVISQLSATDMSGASTKIQELVTALTPLTQMPKQTITSSLNALKKIPETFASLQKVDMTAFSSKIKEITTAIQPLANEMNKVANGFSAFPSKIQRLLSSNQSLSKSNSVVGTSYVNLYAKLKMAQAAVRRLATFISNQINKTNAYIEDMNLFTVALGEFAGEAKEYAEYVGDLMGIDPGEWMRTQGIFMTLATGFGVVNDRAYTMSKNLTQLGYDISSFFNISVEDAMTKLQSGLSGELEPLRRLGYDLSQARLEAVALSLGIDKAVSSMTQAEKAELRYYAIMTQVTTAQGDMARTLEAPSNQLRILSAQVTQAGRAIGSIFIPMLNAVLPYIIAGAKVVRHLASSIASLFGFTMPEVDYAGIGSIASGAEDATGAVNDTTDALKTLQKYTMGFDELNIIDPNSGSGNIGDLTGQGFDFDLPEYDFIGDLTESRVNQIVEDMKEWLGITDDIKSWADLMDTKFGSILTTVTAIGIAFGSWKIGVGLTSTIKTLQGLFTSLSGLTGSAGLASLLKFGWIGAIIAVAIAGFATLMKTNEEFNAKIKSLWNEIKTTFDDAMDGIVEAINAFGFDFENIGEVLKAAWLAFCDLLSPAFIDGFQQTIYFIKWIGELFKNLINLIRGIFTGDLSLIWDSVKNIFVSTWNQIKDSTLSTLKSVKDAINVVLGWFGTSLEDIWASIKKGFSKAVTWVDTNVIQPVVNFFKGLWESVSGFFENLWDGIVSLWRGAGTWFDDKVIQPIVNFFAPIVERISAFFEGCWLIIQAVWLLASTWFNEYVITPIVDFFKALWEDVAGFFEQLWADISKVWKDVSTWFDKEVVTPVVGFFKGVWTDVSGFFKSLWKDVKGVWENVSSWFDKTIISPVKTAFDKMCDAIGGFFDSLWLGIRQGVAKAMNGVIGAVESVLNGIIKGINGLIGGFNKVVQWAADVLGKDWGGVNLVSEVTFNRINVPTYATGGLPNEGQMFIAREAGPEMVGSIGRRTAVVNNEQIVASVSAGVAEANSEQTQLLKEQNTLLRALLEKESGVYLDGKSLTKSVEKYQRERGRVLAVGGSF